MSSINEILWNEIEFNACTDLNNDECWNHTNNCIDWCHSSGNMGCFVKSNNEQM